MTLYVESNFVLEIALGQEETEAAERLLVAAEAKRVSLAIPSFSLAEPVGRVTRSIRERGKFVAQTTELTAQIERSPVHRQEVDVLRTIPRLMEAVNDRELARLMDTIDRLLQCARTIELNPSTIRDAVAIRASMNLQLEDAIVLAAVAADARAHPSPQRHMFANRNRRDFGNPSVVSLLNRANCDTTWSFLDAARRLGSA